MICKMSASEALEALRLVELRDRWLNPPEWVDEPVSGYPKRPVPRDEDAATTLKKRTLTKLYDTRPQWLVDAHEALDAAVAAAYGWSSTSRSPRWPHGISRQTPRECPGGAPEGRTEAPRRRDQAGLAARREAGGRCPHAERTERDRPRAQTPMI